MRKSYHESVHIDDMLAMALCIESGIWRKRRSEDIDYYSSLLNVENLFPEKKGPGRPREPGQAAPRRKEIRIIKKENGEEVQEEVEVVDGVFGRDGQLRSHMILLEAFMSAQTDPDALDMRHLTPASVPSGLPVED